MENVWRLDGEARFRRFVKNVADAEEAWGLWKDDGWASFQDSDGKSALPLWPEREYADACRVADWETYLAKPISVDELLDELLIGLEKNEVLVAVFPTPDGKAPTTEARHLAGAIREELTRYE